MADPSAYLTRLTWLKKLLNGNSSPEKEGEQNEICTERKEPSFNSEMSERLRLLSVLIAIQDTIRYFQEEIKKADDSIRLHIDDGIDYDCWTNAGYWVENAWMGSNESVIAKRLNQAWNANETSLINTHIGNELAGFLPDSVKDKTQHDLIGRSTFSSSLQFLSGPYINSANIEMAIYNAVKLLASTIDELHTALTRNRDPQEYKLLVLQEWMAYNNSKRAAAIKRDYEQDIAQASENISHELLQSRIDEALQVFQESKFYRLKKRDVPIHTLKRICTLKNGFYEFDLDVEIGTFIYKKRLDRDTICQFFDFRKRVELIQTDMLSLREQTQEVFSEDTDFTHSVFKNNHDVRRIYNQLYVLVHDNQLLSAKKQWYVIYLVFKDKNWLDKTAGTTFCKDIQNTFENISDDDIWKPKPADFKEVDSYYKNTRYQEWNPNHANAPTNCAEYKRIADTIHSVFDGSFLLN